MKSIPECIAYFEDRIGAFDEEIDRILQQPTTKNVTEADHDRWITDFKNDRAICRDTISYLRVLEKRGEAA